MNGKIDTTKNHLEDYWTNGHHQRHWVSNETGEDLGNVSDSYELSAAQHTEIAMCRLKYLAAMKSLFNSYFENLKTNSKAHFTKKSANKIASDKAVIKSIVNGYSINEHFEAAMNIKELFKNAEFVGSFSDRINDSNINAIHRFQTVIELSTGKKAVAYMTVKDSVEHGNRIYSLELMLKKYPLQISKGLGQRLELTSGTLAIPCQPLRNFNIQGMRLVVKTSLARKLNTYFEKKKRDKDENTI